MPTRRFLRFVLVLGMAGMLAELILLEHTEGNWQKLPLGLLAVGLLTTLAHARAPGLRMTRVHRIVMALFMVTGALGIYQHYSGNLEFELELNPSRHGGALVWETLKGATPALAPGAMVYLGLLGLGYARVSVQSSR